MEACQINKRGHSTESMVMVEELACKRQKLGASNFSPYIHKINYKWIN